MPEEANSEASLPAEQPETGQAPRLPAPHVHQGRACGHPLASPEGPAAPVGLIWRIGDRTTFGELRRRGSRIRRGPITVTSLPAIAGDPPRVAYAINRHVGGAVVRNRLRRQLRALVTEHARAGRLPGGTYLLSLAPAAASLPRPELARLAVEALDAAQAQHRAAP